jgi:hypothetical protein
MVDAGMLSLVPQLTVNKTQEMIFYVRHRILNGNNR